MPRFTQVAADASAMDMPWAVMAAAVSASRPRRSGATTVSRMAAEPTTGRATARSSPGPSLG